MNSLVNKNKLRLLSVLPKIAKPFMKCSWLTNIVDWQIAMYTFIFHPYRFQKMLALKSMIREEITKDFRLHQFGGTGFYYEQTELAHMHGNGLFDIHFPCSIGKLIVSLSLAETHHVHPSSGWTSIYITRKSNIDHCLQLIKWARDVKDNRDHTGLINQIENYNCSIYEK